MNLNKIVAIMLMSTAVMMSYGANKPAFKIDRIEPEFWYAGMKETQLQLMVYGPQIAEAGFILGSYEGVTLQKVVKLDSPNYLLVYLDVDHNAQPGTLQFVFSNKKGKKTAVNYELKRREKVGSDRYGFDSKDVLYMLMPDRFASGKNLTEPLPTVKIMFLPETVVLEIEPPEISIVSRFSS